MVSDDATATGPQQLLLSRVQQLRLEPAPETRDLVAEEARGCLLASRGVLQYLLSLDWRGCTVPRTIPALLTGWRHLKNLHEAISCHDRRPDAGLMMLKLPKPAVENTTVALQGLEVTAHILRQTSLVTVTLQDLPCKISAISVDLNPRVDYLVTAIMAQLPEELPYLMPQDKINRNRAIDALRQALASSR